jgi:peptidoglycan/xylan/chitin deacetylase (PgdA/CDA1 family)
MDLGGGRHHDLMSRMLSAAAVPGMLLGARARAEGAVVLAYHDVYPHTATIAADGVGPELLRAHLDRLRRWGLRVVDLGNLITAFSRGERLDGLAALTFDDAWQGVHDHVLPLLQELDIPATVFVPSALLGGSPAWGSPGRRIMTADEVVDLAEAGVRIGSHGRTHAALPSLDDGSLANELAGSRAELEDLVGVAIDHLAYPYGHHDARVRRAAATAGYEAGFTFLNGRVTLGLDPFRLPRLTIGSHHRRVRFAYHVARKPAAWPDHQLDRVVAAAS